MQTYQLNFLQPSGLSAPAGFQGSQPHAQIAPPNFLASSALQAPASLQGSQTQIAHPSFLAPSRLQAPSASQSLQTNMETSQSNFLQPSGLSAPVSSQGTQSATPTNMQAAQPGLPANMQTSNLHIGSQSMLSDPLSSHSAVPTAKPLPSNAKFETKSTVWANTLSRGLVNLDISGFLIALQLKTNPLADVGIDFDAINQKEKRLEPKSYAPPVASTIVMGKAMVPDSGIRHSRAGGLAPLPNSMMGSTMDIMDMDMARGSGMGMRGGGGMSMGMPGGVGMGMGGPGMAMGGYGGYMNQPPVGMNMGMGQGAPMQAPGPGMPGGGYNPMMGMWDYCHQNQQPYGGGYR